MPKTVGVAVSNATFHFDKLYTYAVLPEHQDKVRLGSMVLVLAVWHMVLIVGYLSLPDWIVFVTASHSRRITVDAT